MSMSVGIPKSECRISTTNNTVTSVGSMVKKMRDTRGGCYLCRFEISDGETRGGCYLCRFEISDGERKATGEYCRCEKKCDDNHSEWKPIPKSQTKVA